jgi:Protein of unknown function (DUF1186)/SEC-C motif
MTPQEILDALAAASEPPEAALREATRRRAELLPHLLAEVERFIDAEVDAEASPVFWIFHLLGSWREAAAYRPLARFLRIEGERLEAELDDAITDTAPRVIAAVFDGDLQPILDIIRDPEADEIVRMAMFDALGGLMVEGRIARTTVVGVLRDLAASLDAPPGSLVWTGWAVLVADLRLEELRELAEEIFAAGKVDPTVMTLENLRRDFASGPDPMPNPLFEPFGDVVEELRSWSIVEDEEDDFLDDVDAFGPQAPAVNPYRHVGRNDPCPCGSGKKFKRCCGSRSLEEGK